MDFFVSGNYMIFQKKGNVGINTAIISLSTKMLPIVEHRGGG